MSIPAEKPGFTMSEPEPCTIVSRLHRVQPVYYITSKKIGITAIYMYTYWSDVLESHSACEMIIR